MSNVSKEIAIELVEDGQAGNGIVSVTRTYGISASGTTASDTTSPSDITTWSAGSPTVTTAKPYLWVKEITVYTEIPDTTKYYCVGKRGDNGVDAKDFEWAYIRTTNPTPPTILNDSTYTDSNSKTYTADGHLPRVDATNRTDIEKENSGSSSKYYECTDDPKGVNDTWKYEWEIKRTKGNVGADGSTRTWNYYVGEMTLHNNYAESAFIIDIDNDNDQFGTDSDSKVLVEQTRSTKVTLYDGATQQTLTLLAATLKYEDGTSVPTSVATKTTDATTGAVSVTVKQSNTTNTHTEIQAHISAVCAKGTKTIVFTLYKVMGGAPGLTPIIYNVLATNKTFSFQRTDANALTPSSRTSQINVARTEGNTTTILDTAQKGLTFSWGFDDESTAQASSQSIGDSIEITSTDATSHSSVWVELSTGDRETLAIVKDGAKGNSGTSVEAQYAPNSSPTSSQIHTTFQNGDKYMRTRSGSGSWSGWQKIVGENGAETDFTFNISKNKTSTNASTAPANCYYSEWQDAPIAVTTTYPYLWAKVVQKDGNGTTQSTRYIRLTGEDGKSVLAQYSVDGASNWHSTFATGDEWMRTSDNGGTSWSAAMKIVGEDGDSTNFEFGISQYKTATGAPSDITEWADAPIATTSSKPYLWSKVTTPDGTVSYIRLTGEKGASITKSGEVNTYKVSDSGTTTPTGTWYSTKAAANNAYAWSANRYMWTKTVITWSDTSTTTLYSAERNPDDGDAGMSIVIASQSVTYSKQTSGNLDPTTLTYGSYPSSLSKGDWLYSKTTVNYETSEGASAGSTNSYSVSYIGTDGVGQAGRGITGVYEHYKASANSTGETTPTSTDWGTTPTPSDWGKNKPYLWNYERITYSSGTTVERTAASVVAIWTEDGAGIDSITNYYLATSASSGVTTSTSGWTTSVQTMDETNCYLWNYERITYTQGKSSTTTTPHIIGHYGRDGEVITKVNETYRYATNNTGTRPDASSSSWQTEKPTLQKGYWLYTETTIHWSNDTETVLYTSERNPNDGAAGQSIIVDGSTVMKYYVGSSNTTHPAENSSDWKDLDQVTQTQGMWLWSKSTTYYRKANSTSGSHDAGSSVQYNVSYIAEDGYTPEAARGVESITEYYKATNSSSPMSKPTSDSGWDTDPNLSNLTNKWGETYKYLWNYEKVTYNKAPLVERTIPQILAIWTKDGDAGKGIDSITNYYLINNSSTAPSRPSTDGTGGWSTTPTPPNSSNPYLWNYEKIVWLNPSSTTYTDVQMIGHYGKDGVSSLVVDLDNDSDQFGTDSNGLTLSAQNKATGVKLYYGTTLQTITKLVATVYRASAPSTSVGSATATTSGTEVSGNVTISSTKVATIKSLFSGTSGTITFGIVNNVTINDDFIIKIEAFRSSSESRTANFTLKQVKSGAAGVAPDLCNLRPTLAKVSFTKSELNGSTAKKLGCGYTLVTPSGTTNTATAASVSVNGTTYYIWWRYVGGTYAKFTTSSAIYSTGILPSTTQTGVEFVLSSASAANNIAAANTLDYENVPIIKDGTDGKGITSANVWYELNQSSTTAPSDFTLDNFPSTLNAGYYVWEATKVTYTNGSSEFTGKMCLGATTEFLTGTEVYAASASNSTTPTSWSTTYTKTKGYYLWTATRVQYTNGTYAYLNPKCVGYWGEDGTSPYIADLDNEMDSVACDKNGKVKASTTCGTNVSLFYGSSKRSYKITGITKNGTSTMGTGVTVKIDDSTPSYPTSASQTHTVSVTYATTATISSKDDFAITLQDATDTSITRVLHFTINGVREGANGEPAIIFRLNPNVNEIVKKKNGTYIPAKTSKVTCAVLKTTGSETSEEPIDETDDYVAKYKLNGTGSEVAFPTNGITVSDITSKLEIFLYNADSSILLDKETIPLVEDGTDGTSPYLADLDNEMGGVVCDSDGYTTSEQYIETNAQLFKGTTAQTLKSSGGVVCSIAGYPLSSNYTSDPSPSSAYKAVISGLGTTSANIKVYAKANLLVENVDIKVTLTDTNDVSRDATLTMNGVRGGENGDPAVLFNLLPSVSTIKKDANNVLAPTSLTCDVRKITGNSTPTRATSSDGTLRYRVDGDITSTSDGTALTINTGTVNSYTATSKYITFAFFKGTTLVDKERVQIVYDGTKGDAGNGYKAIVYRDNFTEAQWAIYGAIDHTETWDGTSSARNGCGVGDWFLVVGTATDSKDYHTATYECDNSSSNLHGKCINHQVTKNGETYRILYTWNNSTKIEVKDLPCNADYSGSFSGNFCFYLQRLVDGTWTDCPNYYWAIRGFNSSGGINYGYNGSTTQAANSISSTTVNNSTNRYFEVYFLTEAMTPAGNSTAAVTETTTRKIFMSSRISKVPAGDGGLSIVTRPSTMVVNTDENGNTEAASQDFIFDVFKGDVEVTPSQTSHGRLPTGFTWTGRNQDAFTLSCPANTTLNAPAVVTFTVTISGGGSISDSIVLVPNKRGAKGADAIHLDLNNEMDSIQYAGNSTKVGSNVTTTATLYKGKEPIDSGVTYSIISYVGCSASSATINSSTGVATLSGIGANYNKASITIQAAYGSDNYTAVFVVNKIIDKPKYELEFDKNVISVNKSVSSASQENINVYVYKTTINSNGVSTRTLVSSLSSENLKLFHNDHGIIEVDSYNSGFQFSVLYTTNKSLTFYLTTSSASTSTVTSYILDMETIPVVVVENGAKGDVARQPYEWGKWSDFIANNANTFTVNKYESPYFIKEEEVTENSVKKMRESKWLWVGADGTYVPPSAEAGEGQKKATTPSSSSEEWELMVTDFKYLISEAQIADYGKFGAGIFSKDYAFSQYGRIDGASGDSPHYKNFRPEFFKGAAYTFPKPNNSNKYIGTTYTLSTPFEFGRIYLESGITYTFKFDSDASWPSGVHVRVVNVSTGSSLADWSNCGANPVTRTIQGRFITTSGEYALRAYATSGGLTFRTISVNASKAFRPNLYIDWLHGEIYAQLGHFVNVTVEGVMNNLIQEVTSENYTNKLYRFDGTKAWLDVLSCGSVIRFASGFFTGNFSSGYDLYLPCACRASDIDTSATIQGVHSESLGHTNYTLDDVRQCVGKKLYIINQKKATSITFHCLAAGSSMLVLRNHGWDTLDSLTEGSSYIYYNDHYSNVTRLYGGQYARNSSSGNGFFLLECKMGRFNDAECIYWEITASPWTLDNLSNS